MNSTLIGTGVLRRLDRIVGTVKYQLHLAANGQASFAAFDFCPPALDDKLVHLVLEDGRVVNCRMLSNTSYCAVVGVGPIHERRAHVRDG